MPNPFDQYYARDDGSAYHTGRRCVVPEDDLAYAAWRQAGEVALAWTADRFGSQTMSSLQDVLTPLGIFADPTAYAAKVRWEKEVGGVVVGGVQVATDDRSKQMIIAARIAAMINPEFTTQWVSANGAITTMNAAQIISVSDAVLDHVQQCFVIYAAVVDAIAAGTITTTAQIDAAFA